MTMASKYASLPDIDSAPDVYETPDVPLESTQTLDSDSDSELYPVRSNSPYSTRRGLGNNPSSSTNTTNTNDENLTNERLDTSEARKRFETVTFDRVEGSTSSRPKARKLPSTSTYALGASRSLTAQEGSESETTLERLRRLRYEVAELEEEVRKESTSGDAKEHDIAESENDGVESKKKGKKTREVSPAVILQQLQMLRGDLGNLKIDEDEYNVLKADGEKADSALHAKVQASSSLLGKLGNAVRSSGATSSTSTSSPSTSAAVRDAGTHPGGALTPAELEKRVAELEKLVGASEADVDETNPVPQPLLQTVNRLDHLLTLLTQPRHLDSISRRVKVLVSELERLHESRRKLGDTRPLNIALSGGMTVAVGNDPGKTVGSNPPLGTGGSAISSSSSNQLPPDALQKIDALFSLLPRLDPLLPLAPRVLARLRSLSALHSSAADFGSTLAHLKEEVARLGEGDSGLREVVEKFEKSFEENEGRMRGNLKAMEGRVEEVVKRLEAIQSDED